MAKPALGVGSLIAADILTDVSLWLFEPPVNTTVPAGGIAAGSQTVLVWDPSMYVGAMVVVGSLDTIDFEVVTITATNPGTSFTATFANSHVANEPIYGPTFPVQNTAGDPFFTQGEVLQYLSNAVNDFLLRVPLAYIVTEITVAATAGQTALPDDCMFPVRVAPQVLDASGNPLGFYGLRETSQANLDSMVPLWNLQAAGTPQAYFRDKLPLETVGIWPRPANNTPMELVYANRGEGTMGLADGFVIPDVFLPTIKARTLEFCYSKDGEQRSPGMSKFWNQQYEYGCKVARKFLDAVVEDPNAQ